MVGSSKLWMAGWVATLGVSAQDPAALMEALSARQAAGAMAAAQGSSSDSLSKSGGAVKPEQTAEQARLAQDRDKFELEIRRAKAKEKGPLRFAADLFDSRQLGLGLTDGGIAEDYVLGVGDHLQLNVFGSATFELPLQVDGRGSVVIPKVGTVAVAGLSLGKARNAIQGKVGQIFSRSSADLSVTKLREVRIFVLGEVYKPGSFLVPSLSSVVNVLGLSGGPTAIGSYRQVRVMRGGRVVHTVDLYPLRSEGLGNLNFGFQNGDTVFVPLLANHVLLEGGFTRVAAAVTQKPEDAKLDEVRMEPKEQRDIKRQIASLEALLGSPTSTELQNQEDPTNLTADASLRAREAALLNREQQDQNQASQQTGKDSRKLSAQVRGDSSSLSSADRRKLEDQIDTLKLYLQELKRKARGDMRVEAELVNQGPVDDNTAQPYWLKRWLQDGLAPTMQFEMLPGETVKDAVHFAGGFALQAFSGSVSVRRVATNGTLSVLNAPAGSTSIELQRGDVVSAALQRDSQERAVKVGGWSRIQGLFARIEGQGVGDLLKKEDLVLPDTYLERGELVRTALDGTKQYLVFNLTKAMAGELGHNLALEERDVIELYRIRDFQRKRVLQVVGPVSRPGTFEFIEGMRASDLLFRAGLPLRKADQLVAELAHTRDGKPGEVKRLDLTRLLSTENASPVDLRDDQVNPKLEPSDRLSVYSKPDYRVHRAIILSGQVVRPGVYELDGPDTTLRAVIARAGGLTADAMPTGGIFLRSMGQVDPEKRRASVLAGLGDDDDPTSNSVNDVLIRLNETKRNPTTGMIQANPVLHNLKAGNLQRLVVNLPGLLAGDPGAEIELQDGDEIVIPRKTSVAFVVGETASPFASYKVSKGMKVRDLLNLAGGPTRNADTWNIRLLKADGRIVDSWVSGKLVEPGDALLVPQRIRRDSSWQENMAALTPLAILINTFK